MFDSWKDKMRPTVKVTEGAISEDKVMSPDGDVTKGALVDVEARNAVQVARNSDQTVMAVAFGKTGKEMYVRPNAGVRAERRAKGKLAKASRRRNRRTK
jgi:hypothetical protein